MAKYPTDLTQLIAFLKKLPGVGAKTAERYGFQLLGWQQNQLENLAALLSNLKKKITHVPNAAVLTDNGQCFFCHCQPRQNSALHHRLPKGCLLD